MKQYELMYILPSTLSETEAPEHAAKITELLTSAGCAIASDVDLGKKKLAYPINHDRYGYYRLVEFTVEPKTLQAVNTSLRLSRELLRHIIIDKPVKSQMVIEREQALKERLAARRQRDGLAATATEPLEDKTASMTPEELDKKIEEIIEEEPIV